MVPYLQEHGSDIMSILVHEYSFEDELRIAKEEAAERALERGLAQGIEQERMKNARRMKADGMDVALIAKYTGLSKADIAKL
jgi:predicted transposase/invertase (TIGR01784 family)